MYELLDHYPSVSTSRQSEIYVAPHILKTAFGTPLESDGYKVSGEYVFQNPEDSEDIWTIYDYKSTTLYDDYEGNTAPTPKQFWALTERQHFSIGGFCAMGRNRSFDRPTVHTFMEWFLPEIERRLRVLPAAKDLLALPPATLTEGD